jgi:HAD superfamily hydrolase (TIGR01549 family)
MTLNSYLQKVDKTHLVFDFDETLVKLILPWDNWADPIKRELMKLDKSIYENYKKEKSSSDLMNQYILKFGKQARDLVKRNAINFEVNFLKDATPNNELIDFVRHSKNYKMFVWSSNTRPTLEKILNKLGIWNKFEKVVTSLDVDLLKPYTEGFKQIYNPTIPKEKYLIIGDSDRDEKAANQSGIDFFLVDYFKTAK